MKKTQQKINGVSDDEVIYGAEENHQFTQTAKGNTNICTVHFILLSNIIKSAN